MINFKKQFFMKFLFMICLLFSLIDCQSQSTFVSKKEKPNIIVFYIDDMGYSQPSSYGGTLIKTPNIDLLSKKGMSFSNGYATGPICSPSRVGILTGRYQARTGHDGISSKPGCELNINEVTIAQRLKTLGYTTGIVGKWHLGDATPNYLPLKRGFDYFYGHSGNINENRGMGYIDGDKSITFPSHPITSETWANKSTEFIESSKSKNKDAPFFLFLSFNAIHTPIVAKEETLEKLSYIKDVNARTYAGLILEADDAIGKVMNKLRELNLEENTLIYFISDNGGAYRFAEMDGLRGRKWYLFEGGIRVPFVVQWLGHIPEGLVSDEPVIQLDVLPTCISAAGGSVDASWNIDGKNLLPLLTGNNKQLHRDALYWRFGTQFAIRQGDWKLVKALKTQDKPMLVNLTKDKGETIDLSLQFPDKYEELLNKWNKWNKQMESPRWEDERWDRLEFPKKKKN